MSFPSTPSSAPCQVLFATVANGTMVLDLVALEPLNVGGSVLPAGGPISLSFRLRHEAPGENAPHLLSEWAESLTVVRFSVHDTVDGRVASLATDDDEILLAVEAGSSR